MAKQQTLIRRFWHHVLYNGSKVAIVANRKDTKGDLPVPFICNCINYMAASMASPYIYAVALACDCEAPVSWLSWSGLGSNTAKLMSYLQERGLQKGDRVAIISENRREWLEADMAIQSLGGISVPIFPHMTVEQTSYIIDDSGAKFAVVENKRQLTKLANKTELEKIVIDTPSTAIEGIVSFKEIYARKNSAQILKQIANDLKSSDSGVAGIGHDDIATIIYTSGTTGLPKGVMLSQGNIASSLQGIIRHGYKFHQDDLYLSVLPHSHVYGLVNGVYLALFCGISIAFCKITEVGDGLRLFQPTILLGVPKLWRKIRDAIEVELMKASGNKRRIIKWAFTGNKRGPARWLADMLVFRKIRNRLGGRLRVAMSGGAALSADVQEFFAKIGIRLCQGYGMTETTGAIAAALPENQDVGSSGRILDFADVAIVPHDGVPSDLGIATWGPLAKKPTDSKCQGPQAGELWIKGPQIFKGYWNNPEATAKVLSQEGWFKTGDAGVLYNREFLCITGRVNRVIKNENGKWIPVDLIEEAVYTADQTDQFSIIQIIVPTAGSECKFTGALVFVDPVEARLLLEHNGISPSIAELEGDACAFYAKHPLIQEKIVEAIKQANRQLQIWERIKRIQIVEDEATIDGGHLTPTLKVKTEAIRKKYRALEQSLYLPTQAADGAYPEPIDID